MAILKKLNKETNQYESIENVSVSDLAKVEDYKLEFKLTYNNTTIPVLTITNGDYITKYDYLYFVIEHYADYGFNAGSTKLNGTNTSGLWSVTDETIDDKKYYLVTIDCSAIRTSLNGATFESFSIVATNSNARWSGNEKAWLSSKYSSELFKRGFINVELTQPFAYAIQNINKSSKAIPKLNGKTVIFMGDSYTKGATSQFASLCEYYGATADNRGIVSSSICGNVEGTQGFQPMWKRVKNLCTEYTDNGTTANVGAIVFMGGANDGFGKSSWLGSGTNDKDTNHIYGALHSIYRDFRDTFDCPIFTILQPYFPNGSTPSEDIDDETAILLGFESAEQCLSFDTKEYCAYSMQKKQNIVKEMANFYNSDVVDCCFNWHSIFRASDLSKYWSSDGHPTATGYQAIADDLENSMLEYKW